MFLKTHLLASSGSYGAAEAILAPQRIFAGVCTTFAWSERWPSLCATAGSSPWAEPRGATSLCSSWAGTRVTYRHCVSSIWQLCAP